MYPVIYVVGRHWLRVVHEDYVPLAVHFDGNETRAFGGNETSENHCNNVNMQHFTTEVTVVLTSRPTYNSQLDVHVKCIKLPIYSTTSRDLGKETPIIVQLGS